MRKQKDDPEVVFWTIAGAVTLALAAAAFWWMLATPGFVPPCHETYTKGIAAKCASPVFPVPR